NWSRWAMRSSRRPTTAAPQRPLRPCAPERCRRARPERLHAPQELDHPHVPWVRRRVVRRDLVVLLRSLEDETDSIGARVVEQPAERLQPDQSLADQRVAVPVAPQLSGAVVQVEEPGRLADRILQLVQDLAEPRLRSV